MTHLDDRDPKVLTILLQSLMDYTPGPAVDHRNPLSVRQMAASAWAPSGYELCPDCDLEGMVKRGKHRMRCPRCGGAGCWPIDAYDTQASKLEVANGRHDIDHAVRQLSDLTLAEIEKALGRLEQARAKADEDPLWLALERQTRFRVRPLWCRHLRRAVGELPSFQRFLVGWFLVEQVQPVSQAHPPFDERLDEAVEGIHDRLPACPWAPEPCECDKCPAFRAPRWARDRALAEVVAEERQAKPPVDRAGRDAMIRVLADNGRSLRQIGARVGMTAEGVRKVLQRQEREAA